MTSKRWLTPYGKPAGQRSRGHERTGRETRSADAGIYADCRRCTDGLKVHPDPADGEVSVRHERVQSQYPFDAGADPRNTDPGVAVTAQPTSLLHLSAHSRTPCTACGSSQVSHLWMTVADGSLLSLASCHRCEGRTWRDGDTALQLSEVLARARKQA